MNGTSSRGNSVLAILNASLALLLIGVGAYISSGGFGLAIPDWPLSMGQLVPPNLVGGILYEYSHRVLAVLSALLIAVAALFLKNGPSETRALAVLALVLILVQIVVGGWGVLIQYPAWLKMIHAALAHIVFALLAGLVAMSGSLWETGLPAHSEKSVKGARALFSMALLQMLTGVLLRHSEGGALFAGALIVHLLLALGLLASGITVGLRAGREAKSGAVKAASYLIVLTVVFQLALGLLVLTTRPPADFAGQPTSSYLLQSVSHVVLAATLLGAAAYLRLITRRSREGVV